MNDRMNKTSICSIVFLDIIDYSKKSDAEQIEVKNQFNALINKGLKGVAQNDRIILDTGDGIAIAYMGSPEDAMFVALTIRDGILKSNLHNATPLFVRFGINLGPVRIVSDINGQPNIIGDGINVAQRIMSFAQPNQILVSRSYYEVTSRLTLEFSEMFDYSGIKHDKHVREHEVYSVRLHKDSAANGSQPIAAKDDRRLTHRLVTTKKVNLKYVALATPAIVAFFLIIKSASDPSQPTITMNDAMASPQIATNKMVVTKNLVQAPVALLENTSKEVLLPNESLETLPSAASLPVNDAVKNESKINVTAVDKTPEQLLEIEQAKKKAKQKANKKSEKTTQENSADVKPQLDLQPHKSMLDKQKEAQQKELVVATPPPKKVAIKVVNKQANKEAGQEKSGWDKFTDSVKQGGETQCSAAQIAMNQCS